MTTDYHALTAGELLAALEMAGRLPEQDLIRACLERRAELTPGLLDMLTRPNDPAWPTGDPRHMAQIHAGLLLIAYREPLALPIFGALYREPDTLEHNYVEWFDPELPAYGAMAVPMLVDLLRDPAAPIMSRGQAAMILASVGRLHPETLPDIVGALRAALPPEAADGQPIVSAAENRKLSELWTWVVAALADLQDVDSQSRIEAMYRADLIDQSIVGSLKEWQARVMGQDQEEWLSTPKPTDILEIYEQLRVREAEGDAMRATFAARRPSGMLVLKHSTRRQRRFLPQRSLPGHRHPTAKPSHPSRKPMCARRRKLDGTSHARAVAGASTSTAMAEGS